ncbi:MAG TPA: M57 family metalloprotease, partial [Candidatus Krumholzibacteria bacterium]|nr:M57 family metalloprotease [Candidatus Krumholzibacteria bacterium]
ALSAENSCLSTGHYRVEGRVTRLADGGGVEGFPEVLAEVGDYKALSASDGSYVIDDIPDLARKRLVLKPSRPLETYSYYWVVSDTLQLVDQSFDALLFKIAPPVFINIPTDSTISNLDFLYIMAAKKSGGVDAPIMQRWESYPIPVRVDADSAETIAGQNVTDAMEGAIASWNQEAGEQLMMPVTGKPSYGANFTVYVSTTSGGGILGEVRMVDPPDNHCLFQCIPQQVGVSIYSQDSEGLLDRILVHELGHVLWMTHSPNTNHVMSAGVNSTSPLIPDPAEVRMARLIAHMPNGTDLRWYKLPTQP